MKKAIIAGSLFMFLVSCRISSTYYVGQFQVKTSNSPLEEKEKLLTSIKHAAEIQELTLDSRTNADTLKYFGPPYHYIQFIFSENTGDAITFHLDYDGRLATRESTEKIYNGLLPHLIQFMESRSNIPSSKRNVSTAESETVCFYPDLRSSSPIKKCFYQPCF